MLSYLIFYEKGNTEAKGQAVQMAEDHGTKAHITELSKIGKLVKDSEPDVIVMMGHGWYDKNGKPRLSGDTAIYAPDLIKQLSGINKPTTLYIAACSIGKKGGFTDAIAKELTNITVVGHTTSGHVTANKNKRSSPGDKTLKDYVSERLKKDLWVSKDRSDISKVTKAIFYVKINDQGIAVPGYETSKTGSLNVVYREIAAIGFDRFYDMITSYGDVDISYLGMTEEANKIFRAGIVLLRERFDKSAERA